MAKAKGKTVAKPTTIADAMQRASDALVAFALGVVAVAAESASRSASCVASIVQLRADCGSPDEFAKAHVALLGNRDKTKAGRIVGTIRPLLEAAKVDDGTIRTLLKEWRTFAENVDVKDVREAGLKSGLRAAYNVVMASQRAEQTTINPKGEPKESKPVTLAELIAAALKEPDGLSRVLGMVESALTATKDTIRADAIHQTRVKLAA